MSDTERYRMYDPETEEVYPKGHVAKLRRLHRNECVADLLDWSDAETAKVTYTDGWSRFPDLIRLQLGRKEAQRIERDADEPTPDLYDICVVLNEATDAPLGSDLLPFAERIKSIVVEALVLNAEAQGVDFVASYYHNPNPTDAVEIADWIRSQMGDNTP